jgi:hypothetical protein
LRGGGLPKALYMYKNQSLEEKIHVGRFELQFLSTIKSIDHTCFIHQTRPPVSPLIQYDDFEEVDFSFDSPICGKQNLGPCMDLSKTFG